MRRLLSHHRRNPSRHARRNPRAGEHRIYVANLAAYNAGRLRGKWIEPSTDGDELREQVLEAIGGNPDHEWAIHDYDSFPNMGEYPDLDDVAAMAEILEEHPYAIVKAAMGFIGRDDVDALKKWLDEGYSTYESQKDYVEQLVDDMGGPSKLDKQTIDSYFDYDAFGHDLSIDADEEDRERYEGMSDQEIGMEYIDDVYGDKIPADLADRYFDYDSYARDVFMEVASVRTPEGLVVFNAR
jgi:antirestriction protein